MACCDHCEKTGGSCGGKSAELGTPRKSTGGKVPFNIGVHGKKLYERVRCPECRFYAYSDRMQPVQAPPSGLSGQIGRIHHPSCPYVRSGQLGGTILFGTAPDAEDPSAQMGGSGDGWEVPSLPDSSMDGSGDNSVGISAISAPRPSPVGPRGGGGAAFLQGSSLVAGQQLLAATSGSLWSPGGRFRATLTPAGDFGVYDAKNRARPSLLWSAGSGGKGVTHALMQGDGNFVLITPRFGYVPWATGTNGHPGAYLTMQDDGNLVVYDAQGHALWSMFDAAGVPGARLAGVGAIKTTLGPRGRLAAAAPPASTSASTWPYVLAGVSVVAVAALGAKMYARHNSPRAPSRARRRRR